MTTDPRERAERQGVQTRAVIARNGVVFRPLVNAIVEAVRNGGRLLLVGEGDLHLLTTHAATAIVARRHQDGATLPAEVLHYKARGVDDSARSIGPFDAIVAVVGAGDSPDLEKLFAAARDRGARVLCVCLGRARLAGRADIAIDVTEPRAHRVPGLVAAVLHYVCKLAVQTLRAEPLVKARRPDGRARGRTTASKVGLGGAEADEVEEIVPLLSKGGGFDHVLVPQAQRVIMFRCRRCREPILARPAAAGSRGRCPFCERRVKVPRSLGHPFVEAQALLPAGEQIVAEYLPERTTIVLLAPEREPLAVRLEDVTAIGVEVSVEPEQADRFEQGESVDMHMKTPAFSEPLRLRVVVESKVLQESDGRMRLLLPLTEQVDKRDSQRLVRLALLADRQPE